MISRATRAEKVASSARRYCSRRSKTLPETLPVTLARKRPPIDRNESATLRSAHSAIAGGLT